MNEELRYFHPNNADEELFLEYLSKIPEAVLRTLDPNTTRMLQASRQEDLQGYAGEITVSEAGPTTGKFQVGADGKLARRHSSGSE